MSDLMLMPQHDLIEDIALAIFHADDTNGSPGQSWSQFSDPSYVRARYRRLATASLKQICKYADENDGHKEAFAFAVAALNQQRTKESE